jgi:hypothetical protein
MNSNKITIIFICFILIIIGCRRNTPSPSNSLKNRFQNGELIVLNDWVLLAPIEFLNSINIDEKSNRVVPLEKDSAISRYGHFGTITNIIELSIPNFDSIPSFGYFLDRKIMKYLNPEKEIFYFIDGAPCWTYQNAVDLIINKRIIEVQELGVNQATAIWGEKDGKNGALIINTNKKPNSIMIFK